MTYFVAANLLSPNVGLVIWLTIVFITLLFILRRFAWGPITSALEERERKIDDSIRRAEKALEESRHVQKENKRIRRDAELEAQRLLRATREEIERLRADELLRTREEIGQLHAQAQDEISRKKEEALQALRTEVADLAVQAAERILRANLDVQLQRGLVDSFLDELRTN